MRSERRATRNRVYSLVGGLLVVVLCIAALGSMAAFGRRTLDERHYPHPDRVLRGLAEAQERFRLHDLDEDGQRDYAASFEELEAAGEITRVLVQGGAVHGYRYRLRPVEAAYEITATPDVAGVGSQALHYRIDRTQVVRAAPGAPATAESEVFWHPVYGNQWTGASPSTQASGGRGAGGS